MGYDRNHNVTPFLVVVRRAWVAMCAAAGVSQPGPGSGGGAAVMVSGAECDRIFLAANYEEDKKSAESKVIERKPSRH